MTSGQEQSRGPSETETRKLFAKVYEPSQKIHIADGAWGTNFIASGLDVTQTCPETWNLSHPERVTALATAFSNAGASVATTNTFGGNRIRLARFGLSDRIEEINERGVSLSREAIGPAAHLVATLGPTGIKEIEANREMIRDAYAEQASLLVSERPDALLLETMTSPEETQIALQAIRSVTSLDIVCTYAFTHSASGCFQTWSGASVDGAVAIAQNSGAAMVGVNCYPADDSLIELVQHIAATAQGMPLWVKPNAGIPRDLSSQALSYPSPVSALALSPHALSELNVAVLGGCCGTEPRHIADLAARLRRQMDPLPTER